MDGEKIVKCSFTFKNDFRMTEHILELKSKYMDGIGLKDLITLFRQFLVVLGYDPDTAKNIILIGDGDYEALGITKEELSIYESHES